jgi:hypothetical protein
MFRAVPARPDHQPPTPAEETPMPDQPDRVAALRAQLLDELARVDADIQLADAGSRNGADPLMTIAAQEARQVRGRILRLLDQLDQVDDADRIIRLVLDDPAAQAAGDQLHAASTGPPPGLDHDTWQRGQADALKVVARTAAYHVIDQLGIPADRLPRARRSPTGSPTTSTPMTEAIKSRSELPDPWNRPHSPDPWNRPRPQPER